MEYAFYLGIDVQEDSAVLSLVEKEAYDTSEPATYHVRRVERRELENAEEQGAENLTTHVQDVLADKPFTGRTVVVVNRTTNAGQAALDSLTRRGLTPIGVHLAAGQGATQGGTGAQIEGGDDAVGEGSSFFVSEIELAQRLANLHHEGRLELSRSDSTAASELARGVQKYRARIDEIEAEESAVALEEDEEQATELSDFSEADAEASSSEVTETPMEEESYDPFAISAALACWFGEEHSFDPTEHLSGEIPHTGEAKREHRPDTAS